MTDYMIAIKREKKGQVSENWIEEIEKISGVTVNNKGGSSRVHATVTSEGIATLKKRFGDACHIEPLIEHRTSNR